MNELALRVAELEFAELLWLNINQQISTDNVVWTNIVDTTTDEEDIHSIYNWILNFISFGFGVMFASGVFNLLWPTTQTHIRLIIIIIVARSDDDFILFSSLSGSRTFRFSHFIHFYLLMKFVWNKKRERERECESYLDHSISVWLQLSLSSSSLFCRSIFIGSCTLLSRTHNIILYGITCRVASV